MSWLLLCQDRRIVVVASKQPSKERECWHWGAEKDKSGAIESTKRLAVVELDLLPAWSALKN